MLMQKSKNSIRLKSQLWKTWVVVMKKMMMWTSLGLGKVLERI
jgi:hypothetical protein